MAGLLLVACGGQTVGGSHPGAGAGGATAAVDAGPSGLFDLNRPGVDAGAPSVVCGGVNFREQTPVDFYVVVDASMGMAEGHVAAGERDWAVARHALETFVQDPRVDGPALALQYSPPLVDGGTSCNPTYGAPDVELGRLPDQATAIVQSLETREPTGLGSLASAAKSAVTYMKAHGSASSGRDPVVVLVTNGASSECSPLVISDLVAIARDAFSGEPKIRTAVVGLGPIDPAFEDVAKAGVTDSVLQIPANTPDGAASRIVDSLRSLTTFEGCEFGLPISATGAPLDPAQFDVWLFPTSTNIQETIPRVGAASACATNQDSGWYLDDSITPTKAILCLGTCQRMPRASVTIVYGCHHGEQTH